MACTACKAPTSGVQGRDSVNPGGVSPRASPAPLPAGPPLSHLTPPSSMRRSGLVCSSSIWNTLGLLGGTGGGGWCVCVCPPARRVNVHGRGGPKGLKALPPWLCVMFQRLQAGKFFQRAHVLVGRPIGACQPAPSSAARQRRRSSCSRRPFAAPQQPQKAPLAVPQQLQPAPPSHLIGRASCSQDGCGSTGWPSGPTSSSICSGLASQGRNLRGRGGGRQQGKPGWAQAGQLGTRAAGSSHTRAAEAAEAWQAGGAVPGGGAACGEPYRQSAQGQHGALPLVAQGLLCS